jgi:hypothetical protein
VDAAILHINTGATSLGNGDPIPKSRCLAIDLEADFVCRSNSISERGLKTSTLRAAVSKRIYTGTGNYTMSHKLSRKKKVKTRNNSPHISETTDEARHTTAFHEQLH